MIRTDIDIKDALYKIVSESQLADEIDGKVYKDQRPLNSCKEDVIISILAGDAGSQTQTVIANINVYVPDIKRGGDLIEDTKRLRKLCTLCAEVFEYRSEPHFKYELQSQRTYEVNGIEWHCINNRIQIKFNNE